MKKIFSLGLLLLLCMTVFVGCEEEKQTVDINAYLSDSNIWNLPQRDFETDFQKNTDVNFTYYKKNIKWMDYSAVLELRYDISTDRLSNVVVDFSFEPEKPYNYLEANRLIERIGKDFDERYHFQGAQVNVKKKGEEHVNSYEIENVHFNSKEYVPSDQESHQEAVFHWEYEKSSIQLSCTIFPGECYILVDITKA